jgi:hypothetical protein
MCRISGGPPLYLRISQLTTNARIASPETCTAYNQPVHITVPPASQTDTVFGF